MRLEGTTGDFLELSVVRYQLPADDFDAYDANWLVVRVHARVNGREWTAEDPSLLTWEVEWLARWLDALGRGDAAVAEASFLEPNLRFELSSPDGAITIRAYFELELRPPWAKAHAGDQDDLWADLTPTREELQQAAADLREQRQAFPPRAGVGTSRDDPGFWGDWPPGWTNA